MPVRAGGFVLCMHLVHGPRPKDRTAVAGNAMLHRAMGLVAGQSALAIVLDGELAAVVFVRCIEAGRRAA